MPRPPWEPIDWLIDHLVDLISTIYVWYLKQRFGTEEWSD